MKPSILVVDDDDNLLGFMREALTGAGYQVAVATDGKDAMNVIEKREVNLVITDLVMAPRDGFELLSDLRRTRPSLPVIAMSGGSLLNAADYLEMAQIFGVKGVLPKPFLPRQLLSMVGTLVSAN